ncbi:site-specific DNA-methyltransferase [Streptomyces anulatus]|uniref:site-specific DNA-methyltransferase n=1 Tax=Streptomyces anulatus TaxID=1892 RepID=UPI0022501932|nr:site-specific DNA-methyltransferase [Streptomyces anulatus]MCX4602399.1 site-specific DNA-methyltransferase [Streptomyces anulatus]
MPPRKQTGPTPVESITHGDKRTNLPTADAQEFITPAVEEARQMLVERDPSLDPQLVWRTKYGDESTRAMGAASEVVADAPPIYIQEKIDPRVLIENLRRTPEQSAGDGELTLFDTFDGLDELDLVDFYEHQANWSNRMILGDSLQVMASLAEREELRGQVQMIYIDPPYGIKFGSNWQASARKRDVKDGKVEDAAREAEQIKAFRDTWQLGIHSYLSYLRDRLLVARELLTESGSCFVQIGDENVHLVRSLMDEVFGSENFVSQIAFNTTSGAGSFAGGTNVLASVADYIVWYAKDISTVRYRQLYSLKVAGQAGASKYSTVELPDGTRRPITSEERENGRVAGRLMVDDNLTSQTTRVGQTTVFPVKFAGRVFTPGTGGWKTNRVGMDRLVAANRVTPAGRTLRYVRYFDDFAATPIANVWTDIGGVQSRADPKIYVVQTSTTAIQRCMLMCTDPGDLVLDPTCGGGTTAYVAEQWGRRWITIDSSRVALALARQRLMGARYPFYLLADSQKGRDAEAKATGTVLPPARTTNDIRHGFVYERVQHITLKSIANNPDIREGMNREEIYEAIKRHAEFELLCDRPYEDKNTVRVTGPFTVESLSPHRSLAFASEAESAHRESVSELSGAEQPDAPNFEQSILENLGRAGVQNGRRGERIEFTSIESYPGTYIQAVGTSTSLSGEGESKVGIAIGPQYGTVSQRFARDAVKEAIQAQDIDLLCILGFAFDAATGEVTESDGVTVDASSEGFAQVEGERAFGRIKLLMVRMNVDLLMGEDLKKTGAGNLFTVFGEPDIDVIQDDSGVAVKLNGVDVYDPTTGEVRSNDTGLIALWMIDTNYNGDSFFVRHCYFTGGGDPYKRLKNALKAEIDSEAWSSIYSTVSRPFARPDTGKIAVKVINDYGDEVMKVFKL